MNINYVELWKTIVDTSASVVIVFDDGTESLDLYASSLYWFLENYPNKNFKIKEIYNLDY